MSVENNPWKNIRQSGKQSTACQTMRFKTLKQLLNILYSTFDIRVLLTAGFFTLRTFSIYKNVLI